MEGRTMVMFMSPSRVVAREAEQTSEQAEA
jgi:hypothetical protein